MVFALPSMDRRLSFRSMTMMRRCEAYMSVIALLLSGGVGAGLGLGVAWAVFCKRRRLSVLQLEAARRCLEALVDNAPIGVYRSTPDGTFLSANPQLARIYGYDSAEHLLSTVRNIGEDLYLHPEDRTRLVALLEEQGAVADYECPMRRRDGEIIWTSRCMRVVRGEGGRAIHYEAFLTDITERKKGEALREDVQRILRHDLKSPLQGIIGLPSLLLQQGGLTEDQRRMLLMVVDSGKTMQRMIDNSLSIYRMETNSFELAPEPVNLEETASDCLSELEGLRRTKGLQVFADLKPVVVGGEKDLLRGMFANLLLNAMEAAPSDGWIEAVIFTEDGLAKARIRNQGAVPQEVRDRFFTKYATAGKRRGTGLGAYSALLVARAHGGAISMSTSDEPAETTLVVSLPLPPD